MQEWLKDKKNLPIVVALAVFVLLGAGGIVALELGLFTPQPAAPPVVAQQGIPGGPPVGVGGLPVGRPPTGGRPSGGRPGLPTGLPRGSSPAAAATAAVTPKSDIVNPLVGPDPFKIPGGAQKEANARAALAGPKPPLRNVIGPLNLFQIHPPTPPQTPGIPGTPGQSSANLAANYRLSGVITGTDGINAILEIGGQSQSVKPGDSLPDGTQVQNIQTTSITLRSPQGNVFNLPLSAGTPNQGTVPFNGQPQYNPGGFNGQPQYPGGFNGQPQFGPNG